MAGAIIVTRLTCTRLTTTTPVEHSTHQPKCHNGLIPTAAVTVRDKYQKRYSYQHKFSTLNLGKFDGILMTAKLTANSCLFIYAKRLETHPCNIQNRYTHILKYCQESNLMQSWLSDLSQPNDGQTYKNPMCLNQGVNIAACNKRCTRSFTQVSFAWTLGHWW